MKALKEADVNAITAAIVVVLSVTHTQIQLQFSWLRDDNGQNPLRCRNQNWSKPVRIIFVAFNLKFQYYHY